MISNSGVSSILKSSVHGTESTISGGPSILSHSQDVRKTQNPSMKESFESINSFDITQTSNKCYVCGKGFTLRKKHFCKFCQNAVCSDHSTKTHKKPGFNEPQRICDICEQEETKRDIKNEINVEIANLSQELTTAKDTNERLNRDFFEKTSILSEFEQRSASLEAQHSKKLTQIREECDELQRQTEKNKQLLETLRKTLENTKASEQDILEKCCKGEADIERLTARSTELKKERVEMGEEIEKLNLTLKNTINLENLSKSLCQRCVSRLNEAFGKIRYTQYWLGSEEEEQEKQKEE